MDNSNIFRNTFKTFSSQNFQIVSSILNMDRGMNGLWGEARAQGYQGHPSSGIKTIYLPVIITCYILTCKAFGPTVVSVVFGSDSTLHLSIYWQCRRSGSVGDVENII
jgi:hypothetical protein